MSALGEAAGTSSRKPLLALTPTGSNGVSRDVHTSDLARYLSLVKQRGKRSDRIEWRTVARGRCTYGAGKRS